MKTHLQLVIFALFVFVSACSTLPKGAHQRGEASWYGGKYHGRKTASGEVYDKNQMTAAHKNLPFGTRVKVVNPANGRSVTVRINDRGPFVKGRIIDVSQTAAEKLGIIQSGHADVVLYLVE